MRFRTFKQLASATATTGTKSEPQLELARFILNQLQLDRDSMGKDTCSNTTSVPPTPIESSSASNSGATSPALFIDDQVPIVEVCSDGDMVLNVRRLDLNDDDEGLGLGALEKMYMEEKPLARFRVSSAVLQMASHHVKKCLDSAVGSSTTLIGLTKETTPFPTGLPQLWVHKDDNQSLNLLMQTKSSTISTCPEYLSDKDSVSTVTENLPGMDDGWIKAVVILMRILHLTLDSKHSIKTNNFGIGVMAAMVAEIACALNCVSPVVPWINLWITRDLAGIDTSHWYCSAEGHYVGIVVSYVMGAETSFKRWTKLCIRYGRDTDTFVGLGYVWSVISNDMQERRREYIEQFEAVINQTLNTYYAEQPDPAEAPAHCVTLGAFAHAVHIYFGAPPVDLEWLGSIDDLMLVLREIKTRINTVWGAFTHLTNSQIRFSLRRIGIALQNPAHVFWEKAVTVWTGISELHLKDYIPNVEEALDVDGFLDQSIHWEAEADYSCKVEV
ncbi:hypothetical protein EV426DRAFT_718968 [Tirmania nivea]|nr:hypothetical protein EV426DRAFT_718968 [Tirmania nivea]